MVVGEESQLVTYPMIFIFLFIQQEIWPLRAMKPPDSAAEVHPFQLGRFGIDLRETPI